MPLYHFHIHDGRSILDKNGEELPNPSVARQEAIRYAGRVLDDEAHLLALGEDWYMEVTDESGALLFRLDFHVTDAPAVRQPAAATPHPVGPE